MRELTALLEKKVACPVFWVQKSIEIQCGLLDEMNLDFSFLSLKKSINESINKLFSMDLIWSTISSYDWVLFSIIILAQRKDLA